MIIGVEKLKTVYRFSLKIDSGKKTNRSSLAPDFRKNNPKNDN